MTSSSSCWNSVVAGCVLVLRGLGYFGSSVGVFDACITLIFGVRHSDFLEVGTKIEIHNNGLPGNGEV